VNAPRLNPSQIGRYSIYLPQRNGRLSWPKRLVAYRDDLPARSQSPIQVLTRLIVKQLRWSDTTRYRYATPPTRVPTASKLFLQFFSLPDPTMLFPLRSCLFDINFQNVKNYENIVKAITKNDGHIPIPWSGMLKVGLNLKPKPNLSKTVKLAYEFV